MEGKIFISANEALKRYNKSDIRTLKSWARAGVILYQVITTGRTKAEWLFESPEARYERTMGYSV